MFELRFNRSRSRRWTGTAVRSPTRHRPAAARRAVAAHSRGGRTCSAPEEICWRRSEMPPMERLQSECLENEQVERALRGREWRAIHDFTSPVTSTLMRRSLVPVRPLLSSSPSARDGLRPDAIGQEPVSKHKGKAEPDPFAPEIRVPRDTAEGRTPGRRMQGARDDAGAANGAAVRSGTRTPESGRSS
jgi:hypothetical protein